MELNLSLDALLSIVMLAIFGVLLLPLLRDIFYRWFAWSVLWSLTTPTTHGKEAYIEMLVIIVLFIVLELLYQFFAVRPISHVVGE